jgi:hypothetical protein
LSFRNSLAKGSILARACPGGIGFLHYEAAQTQTLLLSLPAPQAPEAKEEGVGRVARSSAKSLLPLGQAQRAASNFISRKRYEFSN